MLIILFLLSKSDFLYGIVINYLLFPFFILFFLSLYEFFFFTFCVFLFIIKYILNIDRGIKKISVNEIRDFFFEKYYKGNGFSKENSYYLMQQLKKID